MYYDIMTKSFPVIKSKFFIDVVDSLVELSCQDAQLANEIKQLDQLAQQKNITFYEIIYQILHKN